MAQVADRPGVGRGKITEVELTNDGFTIKRVCNDRFQPAAGPKDITLSIGRYIPLDQLNVETYKAFNIVGWELGSVSIKSGNVYPSFDGKRLVFEVSCNTVIYLQISPENKKINHRFFLQSHKEFLFDITTRAVAAHVVRATKPIVTIVKYEMYFLLGVFSTVSIPMWLMVTGSDLTVSIVSLRSKEKSFSKLAKTVLRELNVIKSYAPTLHAKLIQIIKAENDRLVSDTWKQLPKQVATDEKAQAQTSGILFGKYAMAANPLTVWGAVLTVLIQAGIKSVTNLPDAYMTSVDHRYVDKVRALTNTNWYDVKERIEGVKQLAKLLNEAKVPVTTEEMTRIIKEVQANPKRLQESFINILDAYKRFRMETHEI